ncbi:MAG TPA: DedA family protein [Cyclobacteriaceae bacterium]|jgi:membrane protein DedA with SNARE-associated domain
MEQFFSDYGYAALTAGTFLEGETALLVASSLVHAGLFDMPGTVFFGFAGSFLSDWLYYLIGRFNGKYFIERRPKLNARVDPVRRFFASHRVQILFSYRFLYGFRVIIPLLIGMSGIRPLQFLGYSLAAGLLWASVVSATGYFLGRALNIGTEAIGENIFYIIAGFAAFGLVIGYSVKHLAMRRMGG